MPAIEILCVLKYFNAKVGDGGDIVREELRVIGRWGWERETKKKTETYRFLLGQGPLDLQNGLPTSQTTLIKMAFAWRISPSGWKTSIKDLKTYPGMDYGTDHMTFISELCSKLQKCNTRRMRTSSK
ncbi:hypothetical protein LAZ67_6002992 [Cordylochernes scorpioides]|uniref:Uncharacterized protein n=1 Tax=Cordylochernes scorpioides TaxID=51811 RepID=A0ABY6KK72_9ARAC|nr:hypothetical protein LAZ67_6002992 [Cordylochernes scorpioides]